MKRFVFNLSKVLQYRQKQEERYKQELKRVNILRRQGEARLADLARKEEIERERLRDAQQREMDVREILLHQKRVIHVETHIRQQKQVTERLKNWEHAARERMISAAQKTRVLEKLGEKKLLEYREHEKASQQKELDAMGLRIWRAQGPNGETTAHGG